MSAAPLVTINVTLTRTEASYMALCVYVAGMSGLMPRDIAWRLVTIITNHANYQPDHFEDTVADIPIVREWNDRQVPDQRKYGRTNPYRQHRQ